MDELDRLRSHLAAAQAALDLLAAARDSSDTTPPTGTTGEATAAFDGWLYALMNRVDLVSDEMLDSLLHSICRALKAGGGGITQYDEAAGRLVFRAAVGDGSEGLVGVTIPLEGSQHGTALMTEDVIAARPLYTAVEEAVGVQFRNVMVAPMIWMDRKVGTISVVNKANREDFTVDDVDLFGYFARSVTLAVEQNRILRQLSMRDLSEDQTEDLLDARQRALLAIAQQTAAMSDDLRVLQAIQQFLTTLNSFTSRPTDW